MSDTAMVIWVISIWILVLNFCAAGVVAILHIWRSAMRRGGRIVTAAGVAASLNVGMFVPVALSDSTAADSEGPFIVAAVFLGMLAITLLITLPGALLVARRLERPGEAFRAFE